MIPADGRRAALDTLRAHRRAWERKPALRRVYREEFFAALAARLAPGGPGIEVGCGPGLLGESVPGLIPTDILPTPWTRAAADASRLPFRSGSLANIAGVDVLHHLASPLRLLREAERCLRPGGRLVLVEPWLTPFSRFLYRNFHQEECDLGVDPWRETPEPEGKAPFEGNQALPYLLLGPRGLAGTLRRVPALEPLEIRPFCLFAYLLSLGFKRPGLLPAPLYPAVARLERATLPLWRPWAALRAVIVLGRRT